LNIGNDNLSWYSEAVHSANYDDEYGCLNESVVSPYMVLADDGDFDNVVEQHC